MRGVEASGPPSTTFSQAVDELNEGVSSFLDAQLPHIPSHQIDGTDLQTQIEKGPNA
jgi:hypothetical protein